jgi:hypothetical protein
MKTSDRLRPDVKKEWNRENAAEKEKKHQKAGTTVGKKKQTHPTRRAVGRARARR